MILLLVDLLLFGSERDRGCTPGPLLATSILQIIARAPTIAPAFSEVV